MASGSETRRKTHPVLVRVTEAEYDRLTSDADAAGISRAALLRTRLKTPSKVATTSKSGSAHLSDTDRHLLSALTRSMGHMAGLMKIAAIDSPRHKRESALREAFTTHHRDLQALQREIRALLERLQ